VTVCATPTDGSLTRYHSNRISTSRSPGDRHLAVLRKVERERPEPGEILHSREDELTQLEVPHPRRLLSQRQFGQQEQARAARPNLSGMW
jgi:hypothetical protein